MVTSTPTWSSSVVNAMLFVVWTFVFATSTNALSKKNSLQRTQKHFGSRAKYDIDFGQVFNQESTRNNQLLESKDNINTLFSNKLGFFNIKDFNSENTIPQEIDTQGAGISSPPPTRNEMFGVGTDPTIEYSDNDKRTQRRQLIATDDYDYMGPRTLNDYRMKLRDLADIKENGIGSLSVPLTKSKLLEHNTEDEIQRRDVEQSKERNYNNFRKKSMFEPMMDSKLGSILQAIAKIRSDILLFHQLTRPSQLQELMEAQRQRITDAERWHKRHFKSTVFRMPKFFGKRSPSSGTRLVN